MVAPVLERRLLNIVGLILFVLAARSWHLHCIADPPIPLSLQGRTCRVGFCRAVGFGDIRRLVVLSNECHQ